MSGEAPAVREALAVYAVEAPETEIVPPGYKQTEVGVIPEDWEVVHLSDLVTSGPQNGYSSQSGKYARGTPTLSLAATSSGHLILNKETVKQLHKTIDPRSDLFLKPGDLLVQRSNTLDLVGTTVVFDGPPGVYVYPDLMMRLRFEDNATAHWFWRYANGADGRRYLVSIAAGSTGSMPKISGEKLRKMPLPAPPLSEQRAIAAALSGVDALVAALDKLIAKKRAVKTAAMQQLLTGRQRLPGFSGEWETRRFSELASPRKERTDPRKSGLRKFCVELEHIESGTGRLLGTIDGKDQSSLKSVFQAGDVLFGKLRPYLRKYWLADRSGICSTEIWALTADRLSITPEFLFQTVRVSQFIEIASTAYGTHMPRSDWNVVKNYEVAVPSLEEQTAIATVLSDMDAEIEALEARREKTRQVKQGMMQELLTGRTRLFADGSSA